MARRYVKNQGKGFTGGLVIKPRNVVRTSAPSMGCRRLDSKPGRAIPKTSEMIHAACLLDTRHLVEKAWTKNYKFTEVSCQSHLNEGKGCL